MSIRSMTVRVRSVPPCVSSQIGSRHLPLKQGIVSSSLTWRTNSIGVWCNASIRVLGTRGDSSILSSPTKPIPNSASRNSSASLVQLAQDTALPALRHRFESGTMLQISLRSCSSTGRVRRFERRGCGFDPCQEFQTLRGSDVAGNMRVFQTRFESSNLSFRSKTSGTDFSL